MALAEATATAREPHLERRTVRTCQPSPHSQALGVFWDYSFFMICPVTGLTCRSISLPPG
jgi:hypothetical protein